jgi:protochlorophyllide reductase
MGGVYCEDCDITPLAKSHDAAGVAAHAVDPEEADRLWKYSADLTGVDTMRQAQKGM